MVHAKLFAVVNSSILLSLNSLLFSLCGGSIQLVVTNPPMKVVKKA